jgi:MFS family permease
MPIGPIQLLRQATTAQRRTLLAAALGWMLDAFDVMLYALVLTHVMRDLGMSKATSGLLYTLTLLASGMGGVLFGFLADRVGRKRALMLSILTYSICSFASGLSTTVLMLAVFRFILGLGMGGEWNTGATLVAETWPDELRAKAISVVQSSWAIGFALAALVSGIVLRYASWRYVFFVGILPALITLWIQNRVPESEMWKEHRRIRLLDEGQKLEPQGPQRTQGNASFLAIFRAPYLKSTVALLLLNFFGMFGWWGMASTLLVASGRAGRARLRRHGNYDAPGCPQPVRHVPRISQLRMGCRSLGPSAVVHAVHVNGGVAGAAVRHGALAARVARVGNGCRVLWGRNVFGFGNHCQRNLSDTAAGTGTGLHLQWRADPEFARSVCDRPREPGKRIELGFLFVRRRLLPSLPDVNATSGDERQNPGVDKQLVERPQNSLDRLDHQRFAPSNPFRQLNQYNRHQHHNDSNCLHRPQ